MESSGAQVRLLTPSDDRPTEVLLDGVGGLLLSDGPDLDPSIYGAVPNLQSNHEVCRSLDNLDLRLLNFALDHDMPVLAVCRGMQLLNVAFGGRLTQDITGHRAVQNDGQWVSADHSIFLSPGSKAAAVIGSAGIFRVNSRHHHGLREAHKSPRLMATAYSVDDGIIEGLESPEHSWVISLQCRPQRQEEVPRNFTNLFSAFHDRAENYLGVQA
jgi:putative glutamine amidotransferase